MTRKTIEPLISGVATERDHLVIAHLVALAEEAAAQIRPYSSEAADKIEAAVAKVASNQPRALTSFRRLSEQLLELGEEHIADAPGDHAQQALEQWERLAADIDKGLRRLENPAAARTYDHSQERPIRCPTCNRLLATPFSKQCFQCGEDWHGEP